MLCWLESACEFNQMGLDVEHLAGETVRSAGGYSFPLILPLIFVFISLALVHVYLESRRIAKIGNKIPGPPTLPIIGNAHYVWNKTHNGKQVQRKWFCGQIIIFVCDFFCFVLKRNFGAGFGIEQSLHKCCQTLDRTKIDRLFNKSKRRWNYFGQFGAHWQVWWVSLLQTMVGQWIIDQQRWTLALTPETNRTSFPSKRIEIIHRNVQQQQFERCSTYEEGS